MSLYASFILFATIFLSLPSVKAAVASNWTGCNNPTHSSHTVTIGKQTTICLVLSDRGNWNRTAVEAQTKGDFAYVANERSERGRENEERSDNVVASSLRS